MTLQIPDTLVLCGIAVFSHSQETERTEIESEEVRL
jgi:hypothetical protein